MKNFIEFKNVNFAYENGGNVFEGLNLQIARGEKVGIVGSSGAGKSTLINLLLKNFAITNYCYWHRPAGGDKNKPPLPAGEGWGEGYKVFANKRLINLSRELRKNQTKQETIFWNAVRGNALGVKFRRQHTVNNKYIADFACVEQNLIIEIEGQHCDNKNDKIRDVEIMQNGYKILRFWNNDIDGNLEGCIEVVKKALTPTLSRRERELDGGDILINGQSIYDVCSNSLRNNISLIPQDIMLFHRTIGENIGYAKQDATEEQIIKAAKMAMLHDFIMGLPEKYNTLVGERGVKLSGGQRQRIAIARAILKNAPILILDEATSALDSSTEQEIQKSINTMLQQNNATVIAIAHRLSTIKHLDRIIFVESGQIIEDGPFNTLLSNQQGKFTQAWHNQVNGMLV